MMIFIPVYFELFIFVFKLGFKVILLISACYIYVTFVIHPDRLLKSDSHLPKKFLFICFNESRLKVMKNVFCFILKALFVLKIFVLTFWSCRTSMCRRNGLIRKIRSISKFLTSQPG